MKYLFTFLFILVIWIAMILITMIGGGIDSQYFYFIAVLLTFIVATVGFKK